MFEKLLAVLPYNPSIVQQLSFYGKRVKRESVVRRAGLVFLLLAFFVQFFAFVSPPQPTVADSTNDLINGGITSVADATAKCLADTQDYRKILNNYAISCTELSHASTVSLSSISSNKQLYSMGRLSYGQKNPSTGKVTGETPVTIPGIAKPLYFRYLWSFDSGPSSTYKALQGTSKTGRTFYVLFNCANLVFIGLPQPVAQPTPAPTPQPGYNILKAVKAHDQTQYYKNLTSKPGDVVDFSIGFTNTGNVKFSDARLVDILPSGLSFVPGSIKNDNQIVVADIANYDAGVLLPGQYRRITFSAKVATPTTDCSIYTNNVTTTVDNLYPKTDTAAVHVCKPTAPVQPAQPAPTPVVVPTAPVTPPAPIAPAPVTQAPAPNTPAPVTPAVVAVPVCAYNMALPANSPDCKPCDKSISSSDSLACVIRHKSAANLTQNIADANNTAAKAGDKIEYTLYAENKGKAAVKDFVFSDNFSDVLDYADVADLNGATKDADSVITWPAMNIAAGQTVQVKVSVIVKSPIPQTPQVAGTGHFDHVMTNVFANTVNINVPQNAISQVQTTAAVLPNTGPGETLAVAAVVVMFAGYFFSRARLLSLETTIAIQDNNSGGF